MDVAYAEMHITFAKLFWRYNSELYKIGAVKVVVTYEFHIPRVRKRGEEGESVGEA